MRLKYYLRGIGVGMLVTAVILMIAFHQTNKKTMSDKEIIERARELGMVTKEESSSGDAKQKLQSGLDKIDKKVTDKEKQNQSSGEKQDQDKTEKDQGSGKSTPTQKDQKTDTNKKKNNENKTDSEKNKEPEEKTYISFRVSGGDFSDVVSEKLETAGLVKNAASFNQYLTDHGYDSQIMPGTYQIPKGATKEEIARILVSHN